MKSGFDIWMTHVDNRIIRKITTIGKNINPSWSAAGALKEIHSEKAVGDGRAKIEDPNLEQVFRESIDKPTGPLHKTDLEEITILDASENEIESLDGIQYIQNLQKLNFSSNQVSDISLLANLTNLEWLEFSDNQVSDISALVLNEGLGSGDIINMENNYLDLTSGSQNMQDIETLINRGVDVIYEPQPVPNPTIELVPKTFDLRDIVKTDEKEQIIQFSVLNTGDADLVIEEIVMENIFSFTYPRTW